MHDDWQSGGRVRQRVVMVMAGDKNGGHANNPLAEPERSFGALVPVARQNLGTLLSLILSWVLTNHHGSLM